MVIQINKKTNVKTAALAEFDLDTHMGFGTGTTPPSENDTDLTTPVIRVAFDETSVKNIGAGTYDFSGLLGLTEGNGNTLAEVATFDAASAGNMSIKKLLNASVVKTVSVELSVGIRLTTIVS